MSEDIDKNDQKYKSNLTIFCQIFTSNILSIRAMFEQQTIGFSMIVGGSILLDTATDNSDIDIIFLIPSLNFCDNVEEQSRNDLIFGNNENSFYFYLTRELEVEYSRKLNFNCDLFNINSIANARVPLIELVIEGHEMDIMFAQLPVTSIPAELKLSEHNNKEVIKENIYILNELIKRMDNLNDSEHFQSILILTGLFCYKLYFKNTFLLNI
uniref:Poly(A) polymerase nucleotidyltransferase domain-containing protein n=1 Tax=Meloidogyne enterolobii TaxID=390850 RepID=A0A6V7XSD7_MELEN|nr:unnamed protein product [Meloidogyne enterolobii]